MPLIVPEVPAETVRSAITGPRTPAIGLLCICAMVAGDFRPSKLPLIASLVPVNAAVTDPEPATVACMTTSRAMGDNRARKFFVPCADTMTALRQAISIAAFMAAIVAAEQLFRAPRRYVLGDRSLGSSVRGEWSS